MSEICIVFNQLMCQPSYGMVVIVYLFGPLELNEQIYTVHDRQVQYNFNIQIYKWYTIYSQNMLLSLQ